MDRNFVMMALDERRVLQIIYAGGGPRTIQPHAIVRKADGTELLEAYQVTGGTEGEVEHGWRHFDLSRIDHVDLRGETFEPRRDFRPVSSESGVVVAQVRQAGPDAAVV
ncbi:MAG: WYL domain-containing protein [Gemmatimonadaceae bacterium]|nr:WYL domain-containing protein [Gemmatimonadaceae bacterium]